MCVSMNTTRPALSQGRSQSKQTKTRTPQRMARPGCVSAGCCMPHQHTPTATVSQVRDVCTPGGTSKEPTHSLCIPHTPHTQDHPNDVVCVCLSSVSFAFTMCLQNTHPVFLLLHMCVQFHSRALPLSSSMAMRPPRPSMARRACTLSLGSVNTPSGRV